jgi:carbonic anhydrase
MYSKNRQTNKQEDWGKFIIPPNSSIVVFGKYKWMIRDLLLPIQKDISELPLPHSTYVEADYATLHTTNWTADCALKELKAGNARFLSGHNIHSFYKGQIPKVASDQHPHSVILSCMDSRVPPEVIFDQALGDIFVARIAGNIEDKHVLGSLEYAVQKNIKLIVVLGHKSCGAIKGCIDRESGKIVDGKNLNYLLDHIKDSLVGNDIRQSTLENINDTIKHILANSTLISNAVNHGEIKIIGAYYDLDSGEIIDWHIPANNLIDV